MKQTTKGTGTMKLLIAVTIGIIFTSPAPAQAHKHCRKHHGHTRCAQIHVARHQAASPTGQEVENTSPKLGRYLVYGNDTIADCTFAAAANYEIAIGDPAPAEAQLIAEFHAAGGSDATGLNVETWAAYWQTNGIGGVRMAATTHPASYAHTLTGPAIANLHVGTGETVGTSVIGESGEHVVLVLGATDQGVTIVSSGAEGTMPWPQWNADALTVYTMVPA